MIFDSGLGQISRWQLSLFPCALALAGLSFFAEMALAGEGLFSNSGVFDNALFVSFLQEVAHVSWPQSHTSEPGVDQAFAGLNVLTWLAWPLAPLLGIVSCVGLFVTAAWRVQTPKRAALGAFAAALSITFLHFRNPLLSNSSDVLLGQLFLLAGFFLVARANAAWTPELGLWLERFLLACFGALVYVGSVVFKWRSDHWWPEGSALSRALQTEDLVSPVGALAWRGLSTLAGPEGSESVLRMLTYLTLGLELVAPLVIVCALLLSLAGRASMLSKPHPASSPPISLLASLALWALRGSAFGLVMLHVGILVLLDIGPFPLVCLALWAPFLFVSHLQTEESSSDATGRFAKATTPAVLFVAVSFLSLAAHLVYPKQTTSGQLHFFLYISHMKHHWSMFSPAPTHSTSYTALVTDSEAREAPLAQGDVLSLPGFRGYAWKVYWDVFWASPWRASRGRGDDGDGRLRRAMGHNLAVRVCQQLPENTLRVVVFARRIAHGTTQFQDVEIARASCPHTPE